MNPLESSYAHCAKVARSRARNFYYSFLVLPREKRLGLCALYAFNRVCDDLSEDEGASLEGLASWREQLDKALIGSPAGHPVWPAFLDTVNRFHIPARYFHEMIDGVTTDLEPHMLSSFEDLYRYCYLVAGVVGRMITHVYGFDDPHALELAERCGIAFQLTNVIRDVREDALRGRVYLPAEDLSRFNVAPPDLTSSVTTPGIRSLLEFEAGRARRFYEESRPLIGMIHRDARPSLRAIIAIYSGLLARIEHRGYDVMPAPVRLSGFEKSVILLRAACGLLS